MYVRASDGRRWSMKDLLRQIKIMWFMFWHSLGYALAGWADSKLEPYLDDEPDSDI